MSIAGVFATCRCWVTSCKAGALGAAGVPLQTPGSHREAALGDQQHRIMGMRETWGFTGAWHVCGRSGVQRLGGCGSCPQMEILVCSSYSGSLATLITNICIFGDVQRDICLFPNLICIFMGREKPPEQRSGWLCVVPQPPEAESDLQFTFSSISSNQKETSEGRWLCPASWH